MDDFFVADEERIIVPELTGADSEIETSLRPHTLSEYVGQEKAKSNLKIYIEAAKKRKEPLDHILLYGTDLRLLPSFADFAGKTERILRIIAAPAFRPCVLVQDTLQHDKSFVFRGNTENEQRNGLLQESVPQCHLYVRHQAVWLKGVFLREIYRQLGGII